MMGRRWAGAASAAVLGQALLAAGFAPPFPPGLRNDRRGSCTPLSAAASAPGAATLRVGRRDAVVGFSFGLGLATTLGPQTAAATPVRAPLPPGPADPADWDVLTKAAGTVESWGDSLDEPSSWPGIADQVKKAPFTQESMDLMFRKAAKNLPANALLGSDAGYWAGVRVEVRVWTTSDGALPQPVSRMMRA